MLWYHYLSLGLVVVGVVSFLIWRNSPHSMKSWREERMSAGGLISPEPLLGLYEAISKIFPGLSIPCRNLEGISVTWTIVLQETQAWYKFLKDSTALEGRNGNQQDVLDALRSFKRNLGRARNPPDFPYSFAYLLRALAPREVAAKFSPEYGSSSLFEA